MWLFETKLNVLGWEIISVFPVHMGRKVTFNLSHCSALALNLVDSETMLMQALKVNNDCTMEPKPAKPWLRRNCSWWWLWRKSRGRERGTDGKYRNRKIHKGNCGWEMRPRQVMRTSYYSRTKTLGKQVPASGLGWWSISIHLYVFAAFNSYCGLEEMIQFK